MNTYRTNLLHTRRKITNNNIKFKRLRIRRLNYESMVFEFKASNLFNIRLPTMNIFWR